MDFSSFQISAAGMAASKLRLDVTAMNLANMQNSAPAGAAPFRPLRVVSQAYPLGFAQQMGQLQAGARGGVRTVGVQALDVAPRMRYEPGHPHADAKGYVAYPAIDQATEMVNMSAALRAYEANVVALNASRTMAARALEIGGQ